MIISSIFYADPATTINVCLVLSVASLIPVISCLFGTIMHTYCVYKTLSQFLNLPIASHNLIICFVIKLFKPYSLDSSEHLPTTIRCYPPFSKINGGYLLSSISTIDTLCNHTSHLWVSSSGSSCRLVSCSHLCFPSTLYWLLQSMRDNSWVCSCSLISGDESISVVCYLDALSVLVLCYF